MIEKFLEYIAIEKKYSPRTIETYKNDLKEFCEYLGWELAEYDPSRVTEGDIKEWIIQLMEEKKNAPRSVKQKIAALHSLYKFLLKIGKVEKDITLRIIAPKVDKPLPVYFKPSEMAEVTEEIHYPDDKEGIRDHLIIQMLYQTGMRQAEMLGLKDVDVDTVEKQVRIFGKRRKERIVPIGDDLCELIEKYRRAREGEYGAFFVIWKKDGAVIPLTKHALYHIVTRTMGEVSTLKKHSPHVLRHTFATSMLNNGADIRTIQSLLGHASLAATQIYTHTTFEQVRKVYEAAHPREIERDKTKEKEIGTKEKEGETKP